MLTLKTNLIAASDTQYEFQTVHATGAIITILSACLTRHNCDCGQWRRESGCDHVDTAKQYLQECQTIEEQDAAQPEVEAFLAKLRDDVKTPAVIHLPEHSSRFEQVYRVPDKRDVRFYSTVKINATFDVVYCDCSRFRALCDVDLDFVPGIDDILHHCSHICSVLAEFHPPRASVMATCEKLVAEARR